MQCTRVCKRTDVEWRRTASAAKETLAAIQTATKTAAPAMASEYVISLEETPFGITFFEGLDIPLVEAVASKGAAAAIGGRGGPRVKVGDRLVGINGRDVSHFSTPHVLALLAEASWRIRKQQSGGDADDPAVVALKFRAAVIDENPDANTSFRSEDRTPDKYSIDRHSSRRSSSPLITRESEAGTGGRQLPRRASTSSLGSTHSAAEKPATQAPPRPDRDRRGTVASVASGAASVMSQDSFMDASIAESQLAELESANRAREEQVAREQARLNRIREERKREEAERAVRRAARAAKEARLREEKLRARELADRQAQLARELQEEEARLAAAAQDTSVSGSGSYANRDGTESIATTPTPTAAAAAAAAKLPPVIPDLEQEREMERELERRRQARRSSSAERVARPPIRASVPEDADHARRLERELAAEARKRKNDLSEIAARARAAAKEEQERLMRAQPRRESAAAVASVPPPAVSSPPVQPQLDVIQQQQQQHQDGQKAKQEEELRRLQRSVKKLEKYIFALTHNIQPAPHALSPTNTPIHDGASMVSVADSQASTPIAQDRLPVRVIRGSITSDCDYATPVPNVMLSQGPGALGYDYAADDRIAKEIDRLAKNPTPTLQEPAVLMNPPHPVYLPAFPAAASSPLRPAIPFAHHSAVAPSAAMRSRSMSPGRVGASAPRSRMSDSGSAFGRPQGSPARTDAGPVRDFRSARVDSWNRDYIRSHSVQPARPRQSVYDRDEITPARFHNFLRRSSTVSGYSASRTPQAKRPSTQSVEALVKQAGRRFGTAGAEAATDLLRHRAPSVPRSNTTASRRDRSPSPAGWEAASTSDEPSVVPGDSPLSDSDKLRKQRAPSRQSSLHSATRASSRNSVAHHPHRQSDVASAMTGRSRQSSPSKVKAPSASSGPKVGDIPVVTLRKIIRATRYAGSSNDEPTLRDVAIKVAEDAFAARNARVRAQKAVASQAKQTANQRLAALEASRQKKAQLESKYAPLPSDSGKHGKSKLGKSAPKRPVSRRSEDDDDDDGDDDDDIEHSDDGVDEDEERSQGSASDGEDSAHESTAGSRSVGSRKSEGEKIVVKKSMSQSSVGQLQSPQAVVATPAAATGVTTAPEVVKSPEAAKSAAAVPAKPEPAAKSEPEHSEDDEFDDEYDEYEPEDDAEEREPAFPPSKLVGKWDDTKKAYDVRFHQTPFGIKFRAVSCSCWLLVAG